ncbi:MAG: nickel pincer cofactor biosynthesis protein LarC [Acidimicrobiia bacterium]|nr:nickel pincer cofactor biosynthesis protein LarC [Acidimicrobiia bacterium]
MTNTLWIHPFNGIAGDMMLGALVDAGADVDQLRSDLGMLNVDGWELRVEEVFRNGIGAINLTVAAQEGHVHRTAGDIIALVEAAPLPARVTERAARVFEALAEAEGHVHRTDPASVHFHEVGGIDAIVDVVGSCLALEQLDVDQIVVAPVANGQGIAKSAHGIIPNPAPATARLLEGVPVRGLDVRVELTTPTGAALVAALADAFGPMPAMTVTTSGFGAGDNELDEHPNLLHVVLGAAEQMPSEPLLVLETNVDDLSGEYLAHAVSRLIDEGALDAWITPIEMKKQRPGAMISALVDPLEADRLGAVLLAETGSIGFRSVGVDRVARNRTFDTVEVDGHEIRIKVTAHTGKAEFADVRAAAAALARPARLIAVEAESIWRAR